MRISLYTRWVGRPFSSDPAFVGPLWLKGARYVHIGDRFSAGRRNRIEAWDAYGSQRFEPRIVIGNNVAMNNDCHIGAVGRVEIGDGYAIDPLNPIYCTRSIVIEDEVLTADKVYISDNLHGYRNVGIPVPRQEILQAAPVVIGRGARLGENVCVIGASLGRANSVVTGEIPDYCDRRLGPCRQTI